MKNITIKKTTYLALSSVLMVMFTSSAFGLACRALTKSQPNAICVSGNNCPLGTPSQNDWFVYTAGAPSDASELTINLADYAQYITAALAGEPLGTFGMHFCSGTFTNTDSYLHDNPAFWDDSNYTVIPGRYYSATFELSGTRSPDDNGALKVPISGGGPYYLNAKTLFCGCPNMPDTVPSAIGVAATCTSGASPTFVVNDPQVLQIEVGGNVGVGYCADNQGAAKTAGFLFNIYAPPGTIPPVGKYSTDYTFGSCPPGQTC